MSRKKRPERPQQPRFSASKNAASATPEPVEAEPRHRLRDEKSNVSPIDALRKAKELSERGTERKKPISVGFKATSAPRFTPKPVEPVTEPSEPEEVVVEKGAPTEETEVVSELNPEASVNTVSSPVRPSTSEVSFTLGQVLPHADDSGKVDEGSEAEPVYEVETESESSAPSPAKIEEEPVSEFIDYVDSPFVEPNTGRKDKSSTVKADQLFDNFIKSTESDGYVPSQTVDDENVEPFLLKTQEPAGTEEDDILEFRRLTPEIGNDEPDFASLKDSILENNERRASRNKKKIRRVVFQDIKRRGSNLLPLSKKVEAPVIASMFFPERKLSAERYLSLYALESPFKVKDSNSSAPSYRRKISPSLREAILEDRPHYSEYNQPESYDIHAPLPDLLPSDFEEEGVPELFIEGGPSVEEVLKAKRAERRDAEGNIKRDLISSDFVEEAFSEFFIDYAERHNQTYEQIKAPVSYDISSTLDDDILDWVPVLPPSKPETSEPDERAIPAGVIVEDREYDLELSHEDHVDTVEVSTLPEPVKAGEVNLTTYRETYMDSLDPELFMSDFFSDDEADYVGRISSEEDKLVQASEVVAGVPVRAEGESVINNGWRKYNFALTSAAAVSITSIVVALTLFRGESLLIAAIVGLSGAALALIIGAFRTSAYKRVLIDFEEQKIVQGRKQIPFSEVTWGEGASYGKGSTFSPKVMTVGSDVKNSVRVLIEKGVFKIPAAEVEALIEFLNQTEIPYSSETDLADIESKKFTGTKRNLNMLINSSFMD